MSFSEFLSATLDSIFAPASAHDSSSSDHISTPSDPSYEWHNNFGTAADYQVPAESVNTFSSNDWSGLDHSSHWSDSGCGYGGHDC